MKELFGTHRDTFMSHFDKALAKYMEYQGADREQVKAVQGEKMRWK